MPHRPQLAGFMERSTSSHLRHQYSRSSSKSATELCLSITVELQVSLRARLSLWDDEYLGKRYKLYMPGTGHRVHTCRRGTRLARGVLAHRRVDSTLPLTATPVTGTSLARPSTALMGSKKVPGRIRCPDVSGFMSRTRMPLASATFCADVIRRKVFARAFATALGWRAVNLD